MDFVVILVHYDLSLISIKFNYVSVHFNNLTRVVRFEKETIK